MSRKLDDPDLERKLKSHYARGGSLHEFLTANPGAWRLFSRGAEVRSYKGHTIWPVPGGWQTSLNSLATFPSEAAVKRFIDGWFKQNPGGTEGEFQRCVDAVAAKGGSYDPRAVCASMERRKYGSAELQRRAKAGKRKAAKARNAGNSEAYRAGMAHMAAAAAKHGTTNLTPSIAEREEWGHAWREFMAGWKAEARREVNPGRQLTVKVGSHYEDVSMLAQARERARVLSETLGYIGFIYRGSQLVQSIDARSGHRRRNPASEAAAATKSSTGARPPVLWASKTGCITMSTWRNWERLNCW